MTAAECEIVADAACHLRALEERLAQWENKRAVVYIIGLLASLPLEPEQFSARV